MLEYMRKMMGGIVAKVLLGLLVISFAVWGVSGSFLGGQATNTVAVGNTKVGLAEYRFAYLSRVNNLERQLNQRLNREQLRSLGIEQAVLGEVVAGAVLDETARDYGLGMSDDRLATFVRDDPAFQDASGKFSPMFLESALRQIGMSEEAYINSRRQTALRQQLLAATVEEIGMPKAFLEAYADYTGQRRTFRYLLITPAMVETPPAATEEQLTTYFNDNQADYRAPEYRQLLVVRLTAEDIADPAAVSDEEMQEVYERSKERYSTPEKRRIEQLTFADRAAADEAARRLAQGTDFEEIMTELGRSAEDVNLGLLAQADVPDQTIAEAAFALPENTASGVVDGIFGPIIVRVTEIQPEQTRPLSEVEQELRQSIAEEKAADALYDVHDRLEDERAAGDSLAEAARKVGLESRSIERIDRQGNAPDGTAVADIPEAQRLVEEAFDTDIGVEADPISLGTWGFVWYEVTDIIEERQKPLDEVRDAVLAAWRQAEIEKQVAEKAEAVAERINGGESFDDAAAELLQAGAGGTVPQPQTSQSMLRSETSEDLPGAAVTEAFSIPTGRTMVAVGPQPTQRVVLQVAEIIEAENGETPDDLKRQLDSALENDLTTTLLGDLQSRKEVTVNSQAIETAITY